MTEVEKLAEKYSELWSACADEIAAKEYGKFYFELTDRQQAHESMLIALLFATKLYEINAND